MVILTTTYNCEKFVQQSLLSIMSQNHKDFTCYITDDMSTDNTIGKIKEIINSILCPGQFSTNVVQVSLTIWES